MVRPAHLPFVILRGLREGNIFITSHTPGRDETKLLDGTVAYEVIDFAADMEEAQRIWATANPVMAAMTDAFERAIETGDHNTALRLAIALI